LGHATDATHKQRNKQTSNEATKQLTGVKPMHEYLKAMAADLEAMTKQVKDLLAEDDAMKANNEKILASLTASERVISYK
jgi:regulator of replication initiation timing